MPTLEEKLRQQVEDLAIIDDPQERLAHVVDRAKRIPPLPASERTDVHRVRGCVSIVWLVGEMRDGRCLFRFDADSPIVRGLLAVLCEFFSGSSPAEISAGNLDPLEALGLLAHLSPTRRNGLAAALRAIQAFAEANATTAASEKIPDKVDPR
jgi:cysteine desulfuration protein SufE